MVTIQEIARKAKVSPSTVSRALHNPSLVKMETRKRILKISQKNNYICNVLARGLITQKSKTLGLLIPTIMHSIFASSVKGIQDCAEEKGYQIIFGNTDYKMEREQKLINLLMERRVDGIILHGLTIDKDTLCKFQKNKFPLLVTWDIGMDGDVDMVSYDDFKSAYKAIEFLIHLGHRRISMIVGPFAASGRAVWRWKAYKKCLQAHGIPYDAKLVVQRTHTLSNGQEVMAELLQRECTAVLCGSDALAIGVMKAIQEAGLKVPHDISVMGYTDSEYSILTNPPLTTIRLPSYELGKLATEILISRIQGKLKEYQKHILNTELVIRGSTGPAKGAKTATLVAKLAEAPLQ